MKKKRKMSLTLYRETYTENISSDYNRNYHVESYDEFTKFLTFSD